MFRFFTYCMLIAIACPIPAQSDSRGDFFALKAEFEARIANSGEDQYRFYLAELEKLESTLVSQKNYASAIAVKNEVDAVRKRLSEFGSESAPMATLGRILFLPNTAKLTGVDYDSDAEALYGWRNMGDAARWDLPDLEPGGYEVILEFSANSIEGGNYAIFEEFFRLDGKIASSDGTIVKTKIGTLKIRSGQSHLTLQATSDNLGGLMHLKSIELIPAWK